MIEKIKQIYYWFYRNSPLKLFRSFIYGLKNLWLWLPTVWLDRDWDHYFLYNILRFKLNRMEKMFRTNSMWLRGEKEAKRIRVCVLLLDRLLKDDYSAYRRHDKKWGKTNFEWHDAKTDPKYSSLEISRANAVTDKDKEQETKEFRECIHHEEYLIQQDIEYLFNTMKKRIRCWWD